MMYVIERFEINYYGQEAIRRIQPQFGYNGFGEYVYYRHYSRLMRDDLGIVYGQEDWGDTVTRVINGVMSIRKDWYVRNRICWDETRWQTYASNMGVSMARMEWLPPGRGLWAMGTEAVYSRGAMPLYNCAYTDVGDDWVEDICWIMDSLMNGVGVGFGPHKCQLRLQEPIKTHYYVIPDTREGWVESVRQLLRAFAIGGSIPEFDYSQIRPFGSPIVTFGGIASGPEPLEQLHTTITNLCYQYIRDANYPEITFKTDLGNLVGVCVVSGNVRRSAEIVLGSINDSIFMNLKNYEKNPQRAQWGWMSNNSVRLETNEDFESLDQIAQANINGHDVGYINMRNIRKGRIGKWGQEEEFGIRPDKAVGLNPCGEIPLEHREVCNLAETIPTRCVDAHQWYNACEYATMYCSTVALLPTHQPTTNAVVTRNRRIGVSIIDFTGWKHHEGVRKVTRYLREGYKRVRGTAKRLANEAGVPEPLRCTTIKPGGTVPKLPGRTSGIGHPTFRYTLRRTNVGIDSPMDRFLQAAGVPGEQSVYTKTSRVYEFPIEQGPAEPATDVSVWEQAMNLVLVQREWADNAVSNTLYFKPKWRKFSKKNDENETFFKRNNDGKSFDVGEFQPISWIPQGMYRINGEWLELFDPNHEEDQLEAVLAHIAPMTKSVSLLPHTEKGIYPQMPEEGLTLPEYNKHVDAMPHLDWPSYSGSDGEDEKFCNSESCEVVK